MSALKDICSFLGVPLAPDKVVGPAQCVTYLGIEIDSRTMTARLPQDKLEKLKSLLAEWQNRKRPRKENYCPL